MTYKKKRRKKFSSSGEPKELKGGENFEYNAAGGEETRKSQNYRLRCPFLLFVERTQSLNTEEGTRMTNAVWSWESGKRDIREQRGGGGEGPSRGTAEKRNFFEERGGAGNVQIWVYRAWKRGQGKRQGEGNDFTEKACVR